jgi:hypothetical protein
VYFAKVGHEDGYAMKAYGEPRATASWEVFTEAAVKPAWPLTEAYDMLWNLYSDLVQEAVIYRDDIDGLSSEADLVFNSIPAKPLCTDDEHRFEAQDVVFTREEIIGVDNLIVYNGRMTEDWYRASRLFGHSTVEYAIHGPGSSVYDKARRTDAVSGYKPVRTNCNCHSEHPNVIRIGRYGRWKRGVLVNHAYYEALERVANA